MKRFLVVLSLLAFVLNADAIKKPKFDYSLVVVPEEGGIRFEKITEDADGVFSEYLVGKSVSFFGRKKSSVLDWWVNPQIALSPDGKKIGYINFKNNTSNIMIKSASRVGQVCNAHSGLMWRISHGAPTEQHCVLQRCAEGIMGSILWMPDKVPWSDKYQMETRMTLEG